MKKLVKRPRRFSGGGVIVKYDSGNKVGLQLVKFGLNRSVVKKIGKLPKKILNSIIQRNPKLAKNLVRLYNFGTEDEVDLQDIFASLNLTIRNLNRADNMKKSRDQGRPLNIVPGGVYSIVDPKFGAVNVTVESVNPKTNTVTYTDRLGYNETTVSAELFEDFYNAYIKGWNGGTSTASEPTITINTEGPATTETPDAGKYRLSLEWTNPDTGEKLIINTIGPNGSVRGYNIGHLYFLTNSDEEFETALLNFMSKKAPAAAPEPTIVIGGESEPVVEEPVKTTLKVGQVFGNDGDKFTITQIDGNGKIHVNRVKGDTTYTDIVYWKELDFFDRLSDEGLSHEPIPSAVEEPVVEKPVVEEPVVEEKPESTVPPEPEPTEQKKPTPKASDTGTGTGTTGTTGTKFKVWGDPNQTYTEGETVIVFDKNGKNPFFSVMEKNADGNLIPGKERTPLGKYLRKKLKELLKGQGSSNGSGSTKSGWKTTGKIFGGVAIADMLWELGVPTFKGGLQVIGANELGQDKGEAFNRGWNEGRQFTPSQLITNATRAAGIRAYKESHNMIPDDWNEFINYLKRNNGSFFKNWLMNNGIYGNDIYTKSWEDQEMRDAYNTWKGGN